MSTFNGSKAVLDRRGFLGAFGAGALALGLTACGGQGSQPKGGAGSSATAGGLYSTQIPDLGGSLCAAPLWIAKQRGFFEEEGLEVKEVTADIDAQKTGINSGSFSVVMGDFSYFQSMESGIKTKIVDAVNLGCIKIVARKDDDSIQDVEDLKGKKVAVNKMGGTPYQVLSLWVSKDAGLKLGNGPDDVQAVVYDDGNLELQALKDGEVDAAALWDPYGPKALRDGYAKEIFDNSKNGDFAGRVCCFLCASSAVLDENPEAIKGIIRAMRKADAWIGENPEEAVDIVAKNKYASVDDKDLAVQMLKDYGYDKLAKGDHDVEGDVRFFAELMQDLDLLKSSADDFVKQYYQSVEA